MTSRFDAEKTLDRAAWAEAIKAAMALYSGHVHLAAKHLGVSRRTLHRALKEPEFAQGVPRAVRGRNVRYEHG